MVLETTRKENIVAVAKEIQERECRLHRALECTQEQMLQVDQQKKQVLANRGSHLNGMQRFQRLKDNEIAMLKRQHETKRATLHQRIDECRYRQE
jgi:hypothetical protein